MTDAERIARLESAVADLASATMSLLHAVLSVHATDLEARAMANAHLANARDRAGIASGRDNTGVNPLDYSLAVHANTIGNRAAGEIGKEVLAALTAERGGGR
ncbi:MAG: hypothetical protein AAF532_03705 [Planctomycetota bacterium]